MKNILLLSIIVTFFLYACEKDNPGPKEEKGDKYLYTLKVGGFQTTDGEVDGPSTSGNLSDKIKYLYYYRYHIGDELKVSVTQRNTDPNFGSYIDSLDYAAGYTIHVFGSQVPLDPEFISVSHQVSQHNSRQLDGADIFHSVVNVADEEYSGGPLPDTSIVLSRINSQLEINITGPETREMSIPCKSIKVVLEKVNRAFIFSGGYDSLSTKTIVVPYNGESSLRISDYVYPSENVTVHIYGMGGPPFYSDLYLYHKIINGVNFVKNRKTIITGDFFGGSLFPTKTFQVSINDAWDADYNITY